MSVHQLSQSGQEVERLRTSISHLDMFEAIDSARDRIKYSGLTISTDCGRAPPLLPQTCFSPPR